MVNLGPVDTGKGLALGLGNFWAPVSLIDFVLGKTVRTEEPR
jgi:hypothetical protein